MESTVEQRKYRRHSVNFQGMFSSAAIQIEEGVVLDLSLGGCRVSSPIHLPPSTAIRLQIRPAKAAPIYVPGAIVRWAGDSAFGVQFQDITEQESRALTSLLGSLSTS